MALETINTQKTAENPEEENHLPHPLAQSTPQRSGNTASTNMVTVDKTLVEKFMLAIEECVGDIEEQRELVDKLIESKNRELDVFQTETIKKFNALIESTQSLSEKIRSTESYENYLEEQVKNANLTKEVVMLEQQLQKEKAEVSLFIRDITNTVTVKLGDMETIVSELKTADNIMEEKITQFKEDMTAETSRYEKSAESKLDEVGSHIQSTAESQIAGMRAECESMLKGYTEKCREHLETVKKQSIDFLKQCENENKKLIEKVPAVANSKFSKKDIAIYLMAGVSIASLLVQMFV
ncbi:MAG: hypothetical protein IJR39_04365 [Treponema sp.]|nr:hypothetical protein [Treponema sp.]